MAWYPKSVSYTRLFKMISSSDHISLKTSASPVVKLSKAGAAFAAAGGTVTEIANGWYQVALNTTDTNTAGDLAFYITGTGADDTDFVDQVQDSTVANLGVNVVNIAGSAVATGSAQLGVNVVNWNASAVATPITAGVPLVDWTPSPAELTGTATASAASTITLASAASATANFYAGMMILITSGTGKGQARLISGYTTGRVATVTPAWTTTPAATATYIIFPIGPAELEGLLFGNNSSGAAVTNATAGILDVNIKNIVNTAAAVDANNLLKVDVEDWKAGVIPAVNVTGVPKVDVVDWLGTAVTAATAGIPDVNTKNIANTAASVDANNLLKVDVEDWKAGVVPAVNVTGVPKVDLVDIGGAAVSTSSAQLGVNVVNIAGQAAALDGNNLLKVDTEDWKGGAVPAVNVTGVPLVDLKYTLGTISPAVAGSVAPDWGQVQNKTATVGLTNTTVGTLTTYTGNTPQTGDSYALLNGANTELAAVPASTAKLVDMIRWLFLLARNKITETSSTQIVKANDGSTTVGTSTVSDDGTTATRGAFS